jgi:hypothetical protein
MLYTAGTATTQLSMLENMIYCIHVKRQSFPNICAASSSRGAARAPYMKASFASNVLNLALKLHLEVN